MKTVSERIILGIDPGTNIMGYGIISVKNKNATMLTAGVLKLDAIDDHHLKLKKIFDKLLWIIETYQPDELAIEAPFFGKNVQSMLKLGRAQGVAIAAALYRQMPVYEYSPRKIKMAVTGRGASTKEQVAAMLQRIASFETLPKYLDATDALAVAICHSLQLNPAPGTAPSKSKSKKAGSKWSSFVTQNPGKIVGGL